MNPSIDHLDNALSLLGGDIWQDGECASEAQRLLAAYADPRTHLEEHPDDAFVLEGMDLDDPEAAETLLRWLTWDALTPAFYDGDEVQDWAEAGAERLGVTPSSEQMHDADERHRLALVELHADTPPHHLLQMDNGFSDDVAYLVIDRAQLQRTMALVHELKLLISDTATPVATWSRRFT